MKNLNIGIIGAGPGGLAAAKEIQEVGMTPVVFEQKINLGGVWSPYYGKVWEQMPGNLSHFHMGYSDYPWPQDIPDFAKAEQTYSYLNDYANHCKLGSHIRYNQSVRTIGFDPFKKAPWQIAAGNRIHGLDGLVVASGVFGSEYRPNIKDEKTYQGKISHSASFKSPDEFIGHHVIIIGDSFTGYEIAARLAEAGVQVTHILKESKYVAQRHTEQNGRILPLDLTSYNYQPSFAPVITSEEKLRKRISFCENKFGNPGEAHENLRIDTGKIARAEIVISDRYLELVKSGAITPYCDPIDCFQKDGILLSSGQSIKADRVMYCTGYNPDLPFLEPTIKTELRYDPNDRFQPLILNKDVFHPSYPSLAFVGLYRGPFFGVMEMQARLAAAVFSGQIPYPNAEDSQEGLEESLALRNLHPRAAFPRPNYGGSMQGLGAKLGVLPTDFIAQADADKTIPMIPADYRRFGIGANPAIAEQQRHRLLQRLDM